ncbi:MAG: serine hydrolase [Anaerolineae bacterium]
MVTQPTHAAVAAQPPQIGKHPMTDRFEFPRTSPESQGVDSAAILRWVEAVESQIHELHSFILLRHGHIIAEGWWSPYGPDHPHLLFSLSKSFTSTAVGLAVAEGRFSLDDPVLSFFPKYTPAAVTEPLAAMQVRHLLSMSTGQAADTWTPMVLRPDGDWIAGFFEEPVQYPPGTHFVYNTGATFMLSAIVQRTTGEKLLDYLGPRLFEPLGIEGATWEESPRGITAGGIGLSLKTEGVARFGELYRNKGMWQGQQLLDEAWIEQATTAQIPSSGMNTDWKQGYGYQFWRCQHNGFRGDGVFGQFCIILPDFGVVLAITSGVDIFEMQQPLDLIWDHLLPAMQRKSLPADPAAERTLREKLASLSFAPARGSAETLLASSISRQTYTVDANALGIETLTFDLADEAWRVRVRTATGEDEIPVGYDVWKQGETRLFGQPLLFTRTAVAASGAWTDGDTFILLLRLNETPFCYTLDCHFAGDEVMVEIRVNVSLESMEPILLTARCA